MALDDEKDSDAKVATEPTDAQAGTDGSAAETSAFSAETAPTAEARPQSSIPPPLAAAAAPNGAHRAKRDVTAQNSAGAPAWVLPAYVAGLAALYVGQRVLVAYEEATTAFTALGLFLVVGATLYRGKAALSLAQSERGSIERLMTVLSAIGVFGVACYFASTEWGLARIGFADAEEAAKDNAKAILTILWIGIIAASTIPLLFAEAALFPMRSAALLEARRVRAAAGSGFVLALACIYGSLFVFTASESKALADYSYFKTTEPGESTRKIVASLEEPVRVTAFFPDVNEVRPEVENYLGSLAQSGKLEIHFADRYLEPQLAKDLKVTEDGTIVFQYKDGKRSLNVGADLTKARAKLRALDKAVNTRLLKLLRSRFVAYLTVGHGEINDVDKEATKETGRSTKVINQMLEQLNFQTKNLGLTDGLGREVPDDATIVLVLGPTEPFAPEELASLQRYAAGGGHLFIALDSDSFSTRLVSEGNAGAHRTAVAPESGTAGSHVHNAPAGPASSVEKASSKPRRNDKQTGKQDPAGAETGAADAPMPARASASALETMNALAAIAGLSYEPTVLANERYHVQRRANDSDRTLIVSNRFSSHASVSTVGKRRRGVLVAGSGALDKLDANDSKVDFALRAPTDTFADADGDYSADDTEKKDSFNMAAAVTHPVTGPKGTEEAPTTSEDATAKGGSSAVDGKAGGPASDAKDPKKDGLAGEPAEMRAFVIADADAATDLVLSNFSENQYFIYDAIRWLGGEESFIGEMSDEEDVKIEHTKQKDQAWFYSMVFGVPLVILGAGIAFSRRSRKKGSH